MSEPSTHDWQKIPEPVEGHGPVMQCTKCKLLKTGVGQPMIPCVPKPDIVARLRSYENPNLMIPLYSRVETCREAADEIERLRAQIEKIELEAHEAALDAANASNHA